MNYRQRAKNTRKRNRCTLMQRRRVAHKVREQGITDAINGYGRLMGWV